MTAEQWIEKYNNAETHQEKFNVIQECFDTHDKDVIVPFHAEIIKDREVFQKVLRSKITTMYNV